MKLLKKMLIGAALVSATFSAQANSISLSADLDPASNSEVYNFSSGTFSGSSFSDYIALSLTGTRDLIASISGNSTKGVSFTFFDLLNADQSVVLQSGIVENPTPKLTYGGLESANLVGNYFIHIAGVRPTTLGTALYSGDISLAAPVPEAGTSSMMLLGLGLMGFIARRRRDD
jgi:hypothetical protein